MQWQPIETAPETYDTVWLTDGKEVELASREWSFDGPKDTWESGEQWGADGCADRIAFKPVMWMPRPTPPIL